MHENSQLSPAGDKDLQLLLCAGKQSLLVPWLAMRIFKQISGNTKHKRTVITVQLFSRFPEEGCTESSSATPVWLCGAAGMALDFYMVIGGDIQGCGFEAHLSLWFKISLCVLVLK